MSKEINSNYKFCYQCIFMRVKVTIYEMYIFIPNLEPSRKSLNSLLIWATAKPNFCYITSSIPQNPERTSVFANPASKDKIRESGIEPATCSVPDTLRSSSAATTSAWNWLRFNVYSRQLGTEFQMRYRMNLWPSFWLKFNQPPHSSTTVQYAWAVGQALIRI